MRKKYLSVLIGMTLISLPYVTFGEGAETAQSNSDSSAPSATLADYVMDDLVITGQREKVLQGAYARNNTTFGLLGNRDVIDTPASAMVIGPRTVESFTASTLPLDKVLSVNPSIRMAGSNLHNDFTYRGIRSNGTSSLINGIPGLMTQFNAPTYAMDHIEFLDGPSGGYTGSAIQYESTAAGGMVNFVTKKAGDEPRLIYKQTFTGRSNMGEYIDVSKRFGAQKQWGVRVNAENLRGETGVKGERVNAASIYVNVDHKTTHHNTNLFMGYRDGEVENGMRWFKLGNVDTLPKAPSGKNNYSFDGMYKSTYGYILGLNHEQKLNKTTTLFFNGGLNHNNLDNNIMAKFSSYTLNNSNGDFNLEYQIGGTPQNTYYAQVGTRHEFGSPSVKHKVTVAFDKSWKQRESGITPNYNNGTNNFGVLGTGNLYTGLNQTSMPITKYRTGLAARQQMWGVTALDEISYKKWNLVLGVHHHSATTNNYNNKTGNLVSSNTSSSTSPTYALMYKPNDNWSIYGSHSEYFDAGTPVGNAYRNAGAILPPAKTKQNEIGVKYQNNGLLTTLSLFDIKMATNIVVNRTVAGNAGTWLLQDGADRHKGVEWTINGRLAKKWSVFGGAMYLNAKKEKTTGGRQDGTRVSAQPYWSGTVGVEYNPNAKWGLMTRMTYFGDSYIRNGASKLVNVPSYTVFDAGVRYKTKWKDSSAVFSLMAYNLFNKNYWMASRGDQVYVATPRTYMMSAQFEL
ncbi:TonB-dependent receptor [Veillonella tobetsuensis]|nr:TonB-dependent siderophore receptor [Veillonella tobetsuensis]